MRIKNASRGQGFLEYAVLMVIVVTVLLAMNDYVQGGVKANIATLERRINHRSSSPISYINELGPIGPITGLGTSGPGGIDPGGIDPGGGGPGGPVGGGDSGGAGSDGSGTAGMGGFGDGPGGDSGGPGGGPNA